jgi:hypothetical protein
MRIEYKLPFRRGHRQRTFLTPPVAQAPSRAPRIARILALAHKLDGLVQSGVVKNYGELARLGHVTPARLSQILLLLHLAPAIQEHILFASASEAHLLTEGELRKIAREPLWDRQRVLFERLHS